MKSNTIVSEWWAVLPQAVFQVSIVLLYLGFLHLLGFMSIIRKRGDKVQPLLTHVSAKITYTASAHNPLAKNSVSKLRKAGQANLAEDPGKGENGFGD